GRGCRARDREAGARVREGDRRSPGRPGRASGRRRRRGVAARSGVGGDRPGGLRGRPAGQSRAARDRPHAEGLGRGVAGGEQEEAPAVALKLWRLRSRPRPDEPGPVVRAAGGGGRRPAENPATGEAPLPPPRHPAWGPPKGKLDPGETDEETARREVEEETGVRAKLLGELSSTRYPDRKGRVKQVRYWLMEPVDGKTPRFRPNHEIDELRWCSARDAG